MSRSALGMQMNELPARAVALTLKAQDNRARIRLGVLAIKKKNKNLLFYSV
jgi:hypothetical protein